MGSPGRSGSQERLAFAAAAVALVGVFAFQLWLHATRTSPTLDEPYHVLAGYRYWQCGDFGINAEHPPLAKLVAAWPIAAWDLVGPPWPCGSRVTPLAEGFQAGTRFVVANGVDRVVVPARLAASLFALALAALVALAAREMFGRAAALVALALVAFEPTLVAHGSLVTTDMALAAGLFAAAYAFYRYGRRPGAGRLALAGLAAGAALASKHSALVALPVLCALPAVDAALAARREGAPRGDLLRRAAAGAGAGAVAALVALGVLWAVYGFRYAAVPDPAAVDVSVEQLVLTSPNPAAAASGVGRVAALLERTRVVPEAYAHGLGYVAGYGERPTYLLGARFATGQWFYFPVAFLVKTSIALLALLAVALASRSLYRGRAREALFLLVPPIAFFAVAMTSGVNIGVRHLLPVYPFAAVAAAAAGCALARAHRAGAWVVAALLAFHAVAAARTAPDYLAFANELWGGTDRAYLLLHDSNVDWGQNLERIGEYLDREGVATCWLASYGNADVARALLPRCRLLPAPGWANGDEPVDAVPPVIEGTVLVSASVLADPAGAAYAPIAAAEPVAVVGGGVLVYRGRFEVPLVAALSHLDRADQLARMGRVDEAAGDARAAVALAPGDAWAHLALAKLLVRAGRGDEARAPAEAAVRLARAEPARFGPAGEEAGRLLTALGPHAAPGAAR